MTRRPVSWLWLGQFDKENNFAKKTAKKLAKSSK